MAGCRVNFTSFICQGVLGLFILRQIQTCMLNSVNLHHSPNLRIRMCFHAPKCPIYVHSCAILVIKFDNFRQFIPGSKQEAQKTVSSMKPPSFILSDDVGSNFFRNPENSPVIINIRKTIINKSLYEQQ